MAGGSGQRMRASGASIVKPLVPALGVPLLERNVHALLRAGSRGIVVAVPAGRPAIAAFVSGRLAALVAAAGAVIRCFVEDTPLGNIGCAGLFRDAAPLLVVYADNLTTLDLATMAAEHRESGADMTIATHKQTFRMPFGEVRVEGGEIRAYVEKPTYAYDVCSAVSVLGPAALAALPADRPTGLSTLVQSLIDAGLKVSAHPHASPWIDVNDAASIPAAEALISAHQRAFDLWARDAARVETLVCDLDDDRVRLRPSRRKGLLTLPRREGDAGDPIMLFDDLDEDAACIRRFAVVSGPTQGASESEEGVWLAREEALRDDTVEPIAKRAIAFAFRAAAAS